MDPSSSLTIDELLDFLDHKIDATYSDRSHLLNDQTEQIKVNQYIERTKHILARFQACNNNLVLTTRLPDEILLHIFQHLQSVNTSHPSFPSTDISRATNQNGWLVITRICQRWRSLAFASPPLWRNIVVDHRVRNQNSFRSWFMERSTPALVRFSEDVWPQINYPQYIGNLKACFLLYSFRMESIDLRFNDAALSDVVRILNREFPALVNLSLHRVDNPSDPRIERLAPSLGSEPSSVQRLHLSGIWAWPVNSTTLQGITHLVLSKISNPLSDFLTMLEACQSLEILRMEDGCPTIMDVRRSRDRPPTSQLKVLILNFPSHSPPTVQFLNYLNISPDTTSIYISTRNLVDSLQMLNERIGFHFQFQVHTLDIRFHWKQELLLQGDRLVLSAPEGILAYSTLSEISRYIPYIKELRISDPGAMHGEGLLPWDEVERQGSLPWNASELLSLLDNYPDLKRIYLDTPLSYVVLLNAMAKSSVPVEEVVVRDGRKDDSSFYDLGDSQSRDTASTSTRRLDVADVVIEKAWQRASPSAAPESYILRIDTDINAPLKPGAAEFYLAYT